jgi:Tol biopolymer transport system component
VPPESGTIVTGPTITPDSGYIDYIAIPLEGTGLAALWRVPFLGGTPRLLVENASSPVGWSPDGKQLAFVRVDRATTATSLVIADANGQHERVLARREGGTMFLSLFVLGSLARPAWSPDGRSVAVIEIEPGAATSIAAFDVSTGNQTSLTPTYNSFPQGLAWLGPDTVVLSSQEGFERRAQLYRLSLPGGLAARITNDLSSYVGLDVDASRRNLVTSKRETRTAVWVGDADGANGREVVPPSPFGGLLFSVAWAGNRVLYDATPNGSPASVRAIGLERGASETSVAENGLLAVGTADGRTIVYVAGPDGIDKTVDGGRPERLVNDFGMRPILTADDRNVVFLSSRTGLQTPWIVPLAGGEPREITHEFASINGVFLSPDSDRMLFTGAGPSWIVCDLTSCADRREVPFPSDLGSAFQWAPDGRSIAYVDRDRTAIWAVPLDGGERRRLVPLSLPADRTVVAFAWSRDGKHLAIMESIVTEDIVLLSLKP